MYGFSFEVRGDFAHFRNPFTLSFFETLIAPQRTSVVGMIGAILGYDEERTIELSERIKVGIKILNIKGFMRDLIRIRNLKEGRVETTPTMRQVLINPVYKIFVASQHKEEIREISTTLHNPKFPVYLGISDFIGSIGEILTVVDGKNELIEIKEEENDLFDCVLPYSGEKFNTQEIKEGLIISKHFESIERIISNTKVENLTILPRIYRTVYSFTKKKDGRIPSKFIDLIMYYNCKIKLKNKLAAYQFNGDSVVLM